MNEIGKASEDFLHLWNVDSKVGKHLYELVKILFS